MDSHHLHPLFNYYHDFALPSSSSFSVQSEFEKQRLEMDCFIQLQSMRLRRAILEEEATTMQQYESRMGPLILQKDEEIAMARSRTRNLEDLLKRAEMEARRWEKAAREGEAIVSDLNRRLQNEREGDDAMSFCSSSSNTGGERIGRCKMCSYGRACVVLLPCRHICCCKLCEPFLEHCPLCHTIKKSTFEAFFA